MVHAALCQELKIVPIVEPEVLMDGPSCGHSIARCFEVTRTVLQTVFKELFEARVVLEGMILKPNMKLLCIRIASSSIGSLFINERI